MPLQNLLIIALVCALAGCASQAPEITASISPAGGGYALSAKEMELNCKELTGRMQLRILEIRDYEARQHTSALSHGLQTGATSIFGGTSANADPADIYVEDRARLEAYNQRLAALNCKSYDLAAELQPKDVKVTPTPVNPPPKKQ